MAKTKSDLRKKVEEQNSSLKKLIERVAPEKGKNSRKQANTQTPAPEKINKKIP